MRVLFASVEMYPLAKVGGLGDVAGSLPKHLKKLGVDISVIMPYHLFIDVDAKYETSFKMDGKEFQIYSHKINDLPVYLIKNDFLSRDRVYGYEDHIRWAIFSKAVIYAAEKLGLNVDIIHCNDWMTGLIPLYARILGKEYKFVLTIHNLKHQGSFESQIFPHLGIPEDYRNLVIWRGKINYMKAGIVLADRVNTVSPTYAKEILSEEFGEGLEEILRENSHKLVGILNGIDYDVWNPEKDKYIFENYSAKSIEKRKKNTEKMKEFLGIDDDKPLFGFVARLVEQKGVDILVESIKKIDDAHFVILGTGRKYLEDLLLGIKKDNVHPIIKYDEVLAHRIYASVDFFLMPSKFEPCGLGQLIAMRYGTIPVVRKTGGLADTVKDINEGGWGFVFSEYSSEALTNAIERAIEFYRSENVDSLRIRIMRMDFSWNSSAKEYLNLYKEIISL